MSGGIKGNWGPYSNPPPPDDGGDVAIASVVSGLAFPNVADIPTMTATGPVTLPGVTSSGPVVAEDGVTTAGGTTTDTLAVSGAATVGGILIGSAALMPVSYMSDEFDASVAASYPFGGNMPVLPGGKLIIASAKWVVTDVHATTFTANGVMVLSSSPGVGEMVQWTSSPNAADLNAFLLDGGGGPYVGLSGATAPLFIVGHQKIPDMGVMPTITVSTPPVGTGVTALKLRIVLSGYVSLSLPNVP